MTQNILMIITFSIMLAITMHVLKTMGFLSDLAKELSLLEDTVYIERKWLK